MGNETIYKRRSSLKINLPFKNKQTNKQIFPPGLLESEAFSFPRGNMLEIVINQKIFER